MDWAEYLAVRESRIRPLLIAHRGAPYWEPENSLASFRLALAQGADVLETDLRITRDGGIVLFHDAELARMSDGEGPLFARSLAELKQLRLRHPQGGLSPERIPLLLELLSMTQGAVPLLLELKDWRFAQTCYAEQLVQMLADYRALAKSAIISFNKSLLASVRQVCPQIPVGLVTLTDPMPRRDVQLLGPFWPLLVLNPAYVAQANRLGKIVAPLDTHPEARMRFYFRLGVDAVLADDPAAALLAMQQAEPQGAQDGMLQGKIRKASTKKAATKKEKMKKADTKRREAITVNRSAGPGLLPSSLEKPTYVNQMFARIAPTYDLMNLFMTGGQDRRWREHLLDWCGLPPRGRLLDVGTGTGDIAAAARRRFPAVEVVGVDFTYEMMAVGHKQPARRNLPLIQGDTFALPFADGQFDAVVSGFLLRNVVDRLAALREQARVTRPGGRVVCLETTPPSHTALGPLFQFYFFRLVPFLGKLVSGDMEAYRYLPQSTVDFPEPVGVQREMERVGLHNVIYRELMGGTVAIHVGVKV